MNIKSTFTSLWICCMLCSYLTIKDFTNFVCFNLGKFRKEFRRAFEHCCQTTRSNQLAYHLNTLYSKSMDSGLGSKTCSAYTKRNTNNLRNTCNDDLAEQSLIRKGTKTSVVRLDIWLDNNSDHQTANVKQHDCKRTVTWKTECDCQFYD